MRVGRAVIASETHHIPFWRVALLLLLGVVILPVYAMYSFGYWMHHRGWPRVIVYPYAVVFGLLNIAHNLTICTVLFFPDIPRELSTTARLKRWKLSKEAGRRELADLLGGLLNRQDMGHY